MSMHIVGGRRAACLTAVVMACAAAPVVGMAQDADLRVSYPGDATMPCDQLAAENARMDALMGKSAQGEANAESTARATGLASSAVVNGALYSGALARVPGLGLFANGAPDAARRAAEDKAKKHEALMQTAQSRQAVMNALYQSKNCGAPTPTPVSNPAPASADPTTVAAH